MSVVILPSRWRNDADPDPAGALAATMLSVAVASIADPKRLQRGRAYAKQNVVLRLVVEPGRLVGLVIGSRPDPYEVIVTVPTIAPPKTSGTIGRGDINALAPEGRELRVSCSCPDWDDPCKHAIAALLVWADELRTRPELLVQWRCSADAPPQRAKVGSRQAATKPTPPPAKPVETNPFTDPQWSEFFGDSAAALPALPDVDTKPLRLGSALVGRVDIAPMITDLLNELRGR